MTALHGSARAALHAMTDAALRDVMRFAACHETTSVEAKALLRREADEARAILKRRAAERLAPLRETLGIVRNRDPEEAFDHLTEVAMQTGGQIIPPDPGNAWAAHLWQITIHGVTGRASDQAAAVSDWCDAAGRILRAADVEPLP